MYKNVAIYQNVLNRDAMQSRSAKNQNQVTLLLCPTIGS